MYGDLDYFADVYLPSTIKPGQYIHLFGQIDDAALAVLGPQLVGLLFVIFAGKSICQDGSPMYMTDTDGATVSSYAFDDFGRNIDPLT